MLTSYSALIALTATTALASPISLGKRADINHDAVVNFPETVPAATIGQLMLKYKPYLYVEDGCVPFPAVDEEGNTSGGLSPSGLPSGDCDSSVGQIYGRSATYDGKLAILYSWYFPKDEPSLIESAFGIGHRHDWEGIVVWLSGESLDAELLGVAASAHGDYSTSTEPSLSGNGPLVRYYTELSILDHSLGFTDTVGGQQPLIAWESMPTVAQDALANKDWGDANVPFIDASFQDNLSEAQL
ncbi:hypothetical protein KC367_g663 [Hortaea werneckii]|uniref:Uncharacterized protein n=1 Tax=Hortaea werneckii EXF-2000 TaxID=1157616 RepID=A0A1Z5TB91_HORWE|nr:hypothetical protein KC358_g4760 [Hortaea werneckii]OTA33307.1 hypothetical protein BTJ68_05943 [Hortaea werneckii EXF-2000]KAI6846375.1 hypothetical protein KC350_g3949 [Hortaea werneckii]KAI6937069.1 hypothetical protein KC341_g5800 [Hortaea werneckii]KAI6940663.1 hypothetical protein KC348_g4952 [Hortaea werneckii]